MNDENQIEDNGVRGELSSNDNNNIPNSPDETYYTIGDGAVVGETPIAGLRDIEIKPLSSGYFVKVGCQTIAVETTKALLKHLELYLDNPDEFETKWFKNKNRNKLN